MRITRVDIPGGAKDGLQSILMEKLGSVIILAGKNGAGKTRILQKIKSYLSQKPIAAVLESSKLQIDAEENSIRMLHQSIATHEGQVAFTEQNERKKEKLKLGNL